MVKFRWVVNENWWYRTISYVRIKAHNLLERNRGTEICDLHHLPWSISLHLVIEHWNLNCKKALLTLKCDIGNIKFLMLLQERLLKLPLISITNLIVGFFKNSTCKSFTHLKFSPGSISVFTIFSVSIFEEEFFSEAHEKV